MLHLIKVQVVQRRPMNLHRKVQRGLQNHMEILQPEAILIQNPMGLLQNQKVEMHPKNMVMLLVEKGLLKNRRVGFQNLKVLI